MRVLVASEAHFARGLDGRVYGEGSENYPFWSSYLGIFDQVGVLARLGHAKVSPGGNPADGPGVVFYSLDDYLGPWQYLRSLPRLRRQAREAVAVSDAFILRVPGAVGYLAWQEIRRRGRPFAVEVLGDPWESLAPGRVLGIGRPAARSWSRSRLEQVCREAPAACYVTQSWLQQRYPAGEPGKASAVFSCSDVRLGSPPGVAPWQARLERIRNATAGRRAWELGFIGSLATLAKAPEVHLLALRMVLDGGSDARFSLVGDGRYRPRLERLAQDLGLAGRVRFLGARPAGPAVEQFLDGMDLFLLASHTEGLPRVLIEAMARGCPAIGSTAGGIPELLAVADLVQPGNTRLLAERISEALGDPDRLWAMARRNLVAASRFSRERLDLERREFLAEVRRQAAAGEICIAARLAG